jgi:surfeit locus 1 family protein
VTNPEQAPHRTARWVMLAGLILAATAFSALGAWQIQRLFWKQDLIARVQAHLAAPAQSLPSRAQWPSITSTADEYKRVTVTGTFHHDAEVLVTASTERGPGYWVMTPLDTATGETVVINRGFVTAGQRDPAARRAAQFAHPVTVTGLLRLSEAGAWILRANHPTVGRWYRRDPEAIANAKGLKAAAPFFIDADATPNPGGWPLGGLTRVQFSNNHLIYALTWFALAALALGACAYVVRVDIARRA